MKTGIVTTHFVITLLILSLITLVFCAPAFAVSNSAPQIAAIPDQNIGEGRTVSLSASFTDADVLDNHIATIDWGDGKNEAIAVTESGGSGTVSPQHYFAANGLYAATLTVTDDHGGSGQQSFMVAANDSSTGKPDLRLIYVGAYWESYAAYVARMLSVDFEIYNAGNNWAYNIQLAGSTETNGVRLVTVRAGGLERRFEYTPAGLITGIVRDDRIVVTGGYDVPNGVGWFSTKLYLIASDGIGSEYAYPDWYGPL